jgi:demethylspheroidene O-methyltransferase
MCDLAPVATLARDKLAARGLQERISVFDRDFRTEPLPRGADVVTLVRVLHDHDDDVAAALLDSVRRSLPPGGTLVIAEPMAETRGAEPVGDAYFGLYLWAMGSGRPRRPDEIAAMLSRAGFVRIRSVATRTPLIAGVIVARVPESA